MASVFALRALLGASLGLGALDLVWINVSLAPQLVERGEPSLASAEPAPAPEVATAVEPEPARAPEPSALAADPEPARELVPAPDPAPEPPPEPAPPLVEAPMEPRDERVYFATGSAVLGAKARRALRDLVESAGADAVFALEGHADYRGGEAFNRSLSRRRAIAVARYLEKLGVATARVRVTFVGEDHASGERELWRDRRVEIQINGGS